MKNVPSVIDGIELLVNGQVKVSSIQVAEKFNKKHFHVLRDIEKLECSEEFRESNYGLSTYQNKQKKESKMHTMTRDGFMFLAMGFNGKEAAGWKEDVIKAFNKMEAYVVSEEQRKLTRKQSAMNAPEMTEALLSHRRDLGKATKPHHYSNEFDMVNRIVLGVSKKKWCEMEEISKENFRDALTSVQIEAVENLQTANTVLIETGMEYQTRKNKLSKIYDKKFAQRCLDEIVRLNA